MKTASAWVAPPDCQECGRCCFSESYEHVRVFGVDWERLGDVGQPHTEAVENRVYMKLTDGHCSALAIDPVTRRFGCSIYEVRPDVCRSLERGTGACRGEWEAKAGRPDVAIERLRATLVSK